METKTQHNFMRDFANEKCGMRKKDQVIYIIECVIFAMVMVVAVWVIFN